MDPAIITGSGLGKLAPAQGTSKICERDRLDNVRTQGYRLRLRLHLHGEGPTLLFAQS